MPSDAPPFEHLYTSGFLDDIARQLEARLHGRYDANAWERLSHIHRARGDLQAASEACRRLVERGDAAPEIEEALAVLSGQEPSAPPGDRFWPAPFVVMEPALDEADMALLRSVVHRDHHQFAPLAFANNHEKEIFNAEKRIGAVINPADLRAHIAPIVRELAESNTARLGVDPFPIGKTECKVTLHEQGGHFAPHRDTGLSNRRRISYGLYFELDGREFSGGDFLLFDERPTNPNDANAADQLRAQTRYTRFVHQHNRLVLFPSQALHQAVQVNRTGNAPGMGRYAVIGHVWEKD